MTWFDYDELLKGGLHPQKPVRARLSVAHRAGFIWSPAKPLFGRG